MATGLQLVIPPQIGCSSGWGVQVNAPPQQQLLQPQHDDQQRIWLHHQQLKQQQQLQLQEAQLQHLMQQEQLQQQQRRQQQPLPPPPPVQIMQQDQQPPPPPPPPPPPQPWQPQQPNQPQQQQNSTFLTQQAQPQVLMPQPSQPLQPLLQHSIGSWVPPPTAARPTQASQAPRGQEPAPGNTAPPFGFSPSDWSGFGANGPALTDVPNPSAPADGSVSAGLGPHWNLLAPMGLDCLQLSAGSSGAPSWRSLSVPCPSEGGMPQLSASTVPEHNDSICSDLMAAARSALLGSPAPPSASDRLESTGSFKLKEPAAAFGSILCGGITSPPPKQPLRAQAPTAAPGPQQIQTPGTAPEGTATSTLEASSPVPLPKEPLAATKINQPSRMRPLAHSDVRSGATGITRRSLESSGIAAVTLQRGQASTNCKTDRVCHISGMERPPARAGSATCVKDDAADKLRRFSAVELWVNAYQSQPLVTALKLNYPSGVAIDVPEFAASLMPLADANAGHWSRMAEEINAGAHVKQALRILQARDIGDSGFLTWKNGEIRDFILAVFGHYGLLAPSEVQTYELYTRFDKDRKMVLESLDCVCLVDALLRACFAVEPRSPAVTWPNMHVGASTAADVGSFARPASSPQVSVSPCAASAPSGAVDGAIGPTSPSPPKQNADTFDYWDIPTETPTLAIGAASPHIGAQGRRLLVHPAHSTSPAPRGGVTSSAGTLMPTPEALGYMPSAPAAVATAAASAAQTQAPSATAQAAPDRGGVEESGHRDALTEARAETLRLRRELEELRDMEANARAALAHSGSSPALLGSSPVAAAPAASGPAHLGPSPSTYCVQRHHQKPPIDATIAEAGAALQSVQPAHGLQRGHRLTQSAGALLPGGVAAGARMTPDGLFSASANVATAAALPLQPSKQTAALVQAARAHCEHRRLERELQSLRSVARRQRGEVKLLSRRKAALLAAAKDREVDVRRREAYEMQQRMLLKKEHALRERELLHRERALRERELQLQSSSVESCERQMSRPVRWPGKQEQVPQAGGRLQERNGSMSDSPLGTRGRGSGDVSRNYRRGSRDQEELDVSTSITAVDPASSIASEPVNRHQYQRFVVGDPWDEIATAVSHEAIARQDSGRSGDPMGDAHAEPEAEVDTETDGAAAAALENRRLRREIEGLRELEKRQRGEIAFGISADPRAPVDANAEDLADCDEEPAFADAESSGAVAIALENRRLQREIDGLRELENRQRGEIAFGTSAGRCTFDGVGGEEQADYDEDTDDVVNGLGGRPLFNPLRKPPPLHRQPGTAFSSLRARLGESASVT